MKTLIDLGRASLETMGEVLLTVDFDEGAQPTSGLCYVPVSQDPPTYSPIACYDNGATKCTSIPGAFPVGAC